MKFAIFAAAVACCLATGSDACTKVYIGKTDKKKVMVCLESLPECPMAHQYYKSPCRRHGRLSFTNPNPYQPISFNGRLIDEAFDEAFDEDDDIGMFMNKPPSYRDLVTPPKKSGLWADGWDEDEGDASCSSARLQQGIRDRPNGIRRNDNPFGFSDFQGARFANMEKCFQQQFDSCCSLCTGEFLNDSCWDHCTGKNHFSACWFVRNN